MGKNLIIKGADFSINAIENVKPIDYTFKTNLFTDKTAYINTNKVLTNNDVLIIKALFTASYSGSTASFLFGWRNVDSTSSTNGNVMAVSNSYIGHTIIAGGYNPEDISESNIIKCGVGIVYTFKFDFVNKKFYVNDVENTNVPPVNMNTAIGTIPLALFTANLGGTIATSNCAETTSSIRRCTIIRNNNRIYDLVPCINPQSVHGMYDMISQTFVGPTDGGSFTATD